MKERYKCTVALNGEPMIFKRYGETETEVRGELESFIRGAYDCECQFIDVEKDKTHKIDESGEEM